MFIDISLAEQLEKDCPGPGSIYLFKEIFIFIFEQISHNVLMFCRLLWASKYPLARSNR